MNSGDRAARWANSPKKLKRGIFRKLSVFLSSVKLALALLIAILACCIAGVTVWKGAEAGRLIFGTLWFNGLLVLLVLNVAFCFFPRMWGRKQTVVSFGMILFHLCFVAMLGGIVYNSLFNFRGLIRITEGEVLPNGDLNSYDYVEHGIFFDLNKLRGETHLIKMHAGYRVDGADKRAAYEIAVGEEGNKKHGILYITSSLEHEGFEYVNDREGYSLLVLLNDRRGSELYGAHLPLQSYKRKDAKNNDIYLYSTGTRDIPGSFPYPQDPLKPLFALQVSYQPSMIKERDGTASFQLWRLHEADAGPEEKPFAEGKSNIGERFRAGNYFLSAVEVRYWVMMSVRHEPGKPIVLASLWVGLGGMIITFIGRMKKGSG